MSSIGYDVAAADPGVMERKGNLQVLPVVKSNDAKGWRSQTGTSKRATSIVC